MSGFMTERERIDQAEQMLEAALPGFLIIFI